MMHGPENPPDAAGAHDSLAPHVAVALGVQARPTPIQLTVVTVGSPPLATHDPPVTCGAAIEMLLPVIVEHDEESVVVMTSLVQMGSRKAVMTGSAQDAPVAAPHAQDEQVASGAT